MCAPCPAPLAAAVPVRCVMLADASRAAACCPRTRATTGPARTTRLAQRSPWERTAPLGPPRRLRPGGPRASATSTVRPNAARAPRPWCMPGVTTPTASRPPRPLASALASPGSNSHPPPLQRPLLSFGLLAPLSADSAFWFSARRHPEGGSIPLSSGMPANPYAIEINR